jgi:hypothetical protein
MMKEVAIAKEIKKEEESEVVAHAYNPSNQEAEAGGLRV